MQPEFGVVQAVDEVGKRPSERSRIRRLRWGGITRPLAATDTGHQHASAAGAGRGPAGACSPLWQAGGLQGRDRYREPMSFDVAHARGLFPALGDGWIRLDPQAGMTIPASVATAVSSGFRQLASDPGTANPAARTAAGALSSARRAIADLVKGDPAGVVLGHSAAQLIGGLADAFRSQAWWGPRCCSRVTATPPTSCRGNGGPTRWVRGSDGSRPISRRPPSPLCTTCQRSVP